LFEFQPYVSEATELASTTEYENVLRVNQLLVGGASLVLLDPRNTSNVKKISIEAMVAC